MHDIICPSCGNRFIARDVAFDLSQYITDLLYEDAGDEDRILSAGFRYYVDEESIVLNTKEGHGVPLFCNTPAGPSPSDPWYPYVVSCRTILDYIKAGMGNLNDDFDDIIEDIRDAYDGDQQYVNTLKSFILRYYHRFFTSAENATDLRDVTDYNVQTAIQILLYLSDNEDKSITLDVRLYSYNSSNMNKGAYMIPDILFMPELDGRKNIKIKKCCRNCGAPMPREFGYHKMVPVVMLGSHFSGKTSFLLAMLYTAKFRAPFSTLNTTLRIDTLNDDPEITAFDNNIQRYEQGLSTIKTDFSNIPILNLLINDTIYSFIDWPGEKFINNESIPGEDDDFILDERKVICEAKHFICCIEPSQVDSQVESGDENVKFNATTLVKRFAQHMQYSLDVERVRSICCVVNKFDMLENCRNTPPVFDMINHISESDIYSDATWKQDQFDRVVKTTQNYLSGQAGILYTSFEHMANLEHIPKFYFPVMPYGQNPEGADENGYIANRGCFAGMPLLAILKTDLVIK